jgi:apolipoprotein N-acyltransferase
LVLASPGVGIWPAAGVAFALMFWLLDRAKIKQWKAMWLVGFTFYLFTTMWIQVPITFFGGAPLAIGIVLALAVAVLSSALFWLPLGLVAKHTQNSVPLFAMVLVALELAKGKYYMGGVPWLNIGQTQANNLLSLQFASIVGESGLSFLVVLLGGYAYKLAKDRKVKDFRKNIIVISLLVACLFGYGAVDLTINKLGEPTHTVRLVQTGIDQEDKWAYSKRREVYDALLTRLRHAAAMPGKYDVFLLPESAFNVNPLSSDELWAELSKVSADHALLLSYDRTVRNMQGTEDVLYNSMSLVTNGETVDIYNKMKLVPFGEYFPFEEQLKPIKEFFFGSARLFSPGETPKVFDYGELKIAPLICFEASFSELIRVRVAMGANVLAVASNESWFGQSLGRHQRLAMDVLRAAEYNRYLLRSTQDGISMVLDPAGRRLNVFPEKEYHTADIGFSPMNGMTVFANFGYTWFLIVVAAYGLVRINTRRRIA